MNDAPRGRRTDILDVAWRLGLLTRLKKSGGEYVGGCPQCGGRDRFAINPSKGLWNCRGCGRGGDAIALVRHVTGASFASAVEQVDHAPSIRSQPPPRPPPPLPTTTTEDAIRMWSASIDPRGTVVEWYFASRWLTLGDDVAGDVLRWNPCIGAILALFRNVLTGEPQAISRTFLDREGRKIERKFLGPVSGAAIMLDPFDFVTTGLHVGEGVETCMTARQFNLRPVWALGSAAAVAAFPILGGVECLTLLKEADDASERAVGACASRWHAAGREVFINQPTRGKDQRRDQGQGRVMNDDRAPFIAKKYTPPPIGEAKDAQVVLLNAADIEPAPVHWLWRYWLQRGVFNLLAGQSTAGKSTIALSFSATITSGGRWPDNHAAEQGGVVFWSGEDGIKDTLLPRFLAAGGVRSNMDFIEGVRDGGRKRPFDPAADMPKLTQTVQRLKDVRLIVLDPVAVVVKGDSHKNVETRVGLQPFADLCAQTGACGLGVHHFTKNTAGGNPLDRVSGSLAFHALPRCVLIAARDQNGGQNARRALMRAKVSNGPDWGGFDYKLD